MRRIFLLASVGVAAFAQPSQPAPLREAVPLEPVRAIVDALKTHAVVAISDGRTHGDVQGREFVDRLIAALVADWVIVVVVILGRGEWFLQEWRKIRRRRDS